MPVQQRENKVATRLLEMPNEQRRKAARSSPWVSVTDPPTSLRIISRLLSEVRLETRSSFTTGIRLAAMGLHGGDTVRVLPALALCKRSIIASQSEMVFSASLNDELSVDSRRRSLASAILADVVDDPQLFRWRSATGELRTVASWEVERRISRDRFLSFQTVFN